MKLNNKIVLSTLTAALITFTGCGGGSDSAPADTETPATDTPVVEAPITDTPVVEDPVVVETPTLSPNFTGDSASGIQTAFDEQTQRVYPTLTKETLSGDITADKTLTADKIWVLDGLVAVKGATLTIEAGTIIAGKYGTGANTSYMVIDKDAKIEANGTTTNPIIFTSQKAVDGDKADYGQWGGLTIIGTASNAQVTAYEVNEDFVADSTDMTGNSGTLNNVMILNSGITMAEDKEINGLSLVGVGSGTTISNITVDLSDDDGIEAWGGTVDMTNINITRCTDDHFDIDDGYSGTVTNLMINNTTGNAGIEMSGDTHATFNGFSITMNESAKEGAVYFKKDGIGANMKNGTISYNVSGTSDGAINSKGTFDSANTSFENVTILGTTNLFTGDSASGIQTAFDEQTQRVYPTLTKETLSGDITADKTLTADKIWVLDGLVAVKGATLTIEAGTIIAGKYGTGANTSYMVIDKDAKIEANGTTTNPIIFTSQKAVDGDKADYGQWGGLTIIGTASNAQVTAYEVNEDFVADSTDMTGNSGTLNNVMILNSGITMAEDKEINGLSLVGVGSGTTISNITVDLSDDDGIEAWGGTVDMTNINITRCTDDHFDIDDGYSGTVTNLMINNTTGNAGIEMSGDTHATFNGFSITMNESAKEGAVYFKKDGIGANMKNGTISYNVSGTSDGAINSKGTFDSANTSFENVTILGAK